MSNERPKGVNLFLWNLLLQIRAISNKPMDVIWETVQDYHRIGNGEYSLEGVCVVIMEGIALNQGIIWKEETSNDCC